MANKGFFVIFRIGWQHNWNLLKCVKASVSKCVIGTKRELEKKEKKIYF